MKRLVLKGLALVMVAFPATTHAQRVFEDAGGDTSIFLESGGGFIRANVTESSVRASYLFDVSNKPYRFGFEVFGKLSGKVANIFQEDRPAPGAGVRISVGKKHLFSERPTGVPLATRRLSDDWLTLQFGYTRARYTLLSEERSFADQVGKKNFDGFSATLAYNALFRSQRGPVLWGISGGAERKNNIEDLDEVEVNDEVFSSSEGNTQRSVIFRRNAFRGTYTEKIAVPIQSDLVWFPAKFQSRIGTNFFVRSNIGEGNKYIEPGVGLFLSEDGAPTRVIAGISVSVREGKGRVGLIAGFNF